MARPAVTMDTSVYQSVASAGSIPFVANVQARLMAISMGDANTVNIRYQTTVGSTAVEQSPFGSYLEYTLRGSTPSQTLSSGQLNQNGNGEFVVTGVASFPIQTVYINIYAHQQFALIGGDLTATITKTFTVKDHPQSSLLIVHTPDTLLRLPPATTTDGTYFIIKNTTSASSTILLQNAADASGSTFFEYFPASASFTDFSLNGDPTLSLDKNCAIGIFSYQNKWYIASFYTGAPSWTSGYTFPADVQLSNTSDVFFTDIGNNNKSVVLPDPSVCPSCIIVSDRTSTTNSNGVLRIKAPAGQVLDGIVGKTFHDLVVSNLRAGACAIHFIADPTIPAWYIASVSDFQYSDNYADFSIPAGVSSFTWELGIQTTSRLVSNVHDSRSFTIATLAPSSLDISAGALRVVKQFTTDTGSYLGFVSETSGATFPASYGQTPNQYLFQYTGTGLNACVFVEIRRGDGTTRFYPLAIYPFVS